MFSLALGLIFLVGALSGRLSLIIVHDTIGLALFGLTLIGWGTFRIWSHRRKAQAAPRSEMTHDHCGTVTP
jgi:hypothetical protein